MCLLERLNDCRARIIFAARRAASECGLNASNIRKHTAASVSSAATVSMGEGGTWNLLATRRIEVPLIKHEIICQNGKSCLHQAR